jgi:chemotaxis-related protein WspD
LERHTHCRNCPVFAEAGARLLDRALPTGYREEWTRRLAEAKTSAAVKKSVVVFRVGAEWLALPTPVFQEVAERRVIRSLPHQQNNFVLGLASVRGELLLCISIAGLLGIKTEAAGNTRRPAYDRLLVVGQHGQRLAFPVDEVLGVQRYLPAEVAELSGGGAFAATCVGGVLKLEGRAVGLLDAEKFFIAVDRSFA